MKESCVKEGPGMCHKRGKEEDIKKGETVSEWRTEQVQATSMKEEVLFEADGGW